MKLNLYRVTTNPNYAGPMYVVAQSVAEVIAEIPATSVELVQINLNITQQSFLDLKTDRTSRTGSNT